MFGVETLSGWSRTLRYVPLPSNTYIIFAILGWDEESGTEHMSNGIVILYLFGAKR